MAAHSSCSCNFSDCLQNLVCNVSRVGGGIVGVGGMVLAATVLDAFAQVVLSALRRVSSSGLDETIPVYAYPLSTSTPNHPICLLMDIGSLSSRSASSLRCIAERFAFTCRWRAEQCAPNIVVPTSLAFTNLIPSTELLGYPAETTFHAFTRLLVAGHRHFVLLPLFLAPSTSIKKAEAQLQQLACTMTNDHVVISVAHHLAGTHCSKFGFLEDFRIAHGLANNVRAVIEQHQVNIQPHVVVVDHGSPTRAVTYIRNLLTTQVSKLLSGSVKSVHAASMERRPGPAYDFNEPLLENVVEKIQWSFGDTIIIALAFISPGRHAGPGGDIESIVKNIKSRYPRLDIYITNVLGSNFFLLDALVERYLDCIPNCVL
eukprot:gene3712-6256_t